MASSTGRTPRVAYLVKRVERGLRARLDRALAPLGVTTPEYTALSILADRVGISSAQLARRVFVTPQAMNQIVLALEGRGILRRRASPSHGRVMEISLTSRGRALLDACDEATLPVEKHLLDALSREDATALRRVLSACANALVEGEPAGGPGKGANGHGRHRQSAAELRDE